MQKENQQEEGRQEKTVTDEITIEPAQVEAQASGEHQVHHIKPVLAIEPSEIITGVTIEPEPLLELLRKLLEEEKGALALSVAIAHYFDQLQLKIFRFYILAPFIEYFVGFAVGGIVQFSMESLFPERYLGLYVEGLPVTVASAIAFANTNLAHGVYRNHVLEAYLKKIDAAEMARILVTALKDEDFVKLLSSEFIEAVWAEVERQSSGDWGEVKPLFDESLAKKLYQLTKGVLWRPYVFHVGPGALLNSVFNFSINALALLNPYVGYSISIAVRVLQSFVYPLAGKYIPYLKSSFSIRGWAGPSVSGLVGIVLLDFILFLTGAVINDPWRSLMSGAVGGVLSVFPRFIEWRWFRSRLEPHTKQLIRDSLSIRKQMKKLLFGSAKQAAATETTPLIITEPTPNQEAVSISTQPKLQRSCTFL